MWKSDVNSAAASQSRIQNMGRKDLLALWERIKARNVPAEWQPGKAFEYLVCRAFDLEHVDVTWPYTVTYPQKLGPVEQMDGAVRLDGVTFLLESKDQDEAASIEAIAKLRFRLERRPPGTMAVLFSVSNVTRVTEFFAQFASPLNVLLWNFSDLDFALRRAKMAVGLREKMRYAGENGLPMRTLGGNT